MADEDESVEGAPTDEPEVPVTQEPEASEAQAVEPEPEAAQEPQAQAEEAEATEEPAAEPQADADGAAAAGAAPAPAAPARAEPQPILAPKERRRRARAAMAPATRPAVSVQERQDERDAERAKTRQGVVTSDKADKTITVRVDSARRHRRYKKIVRRHTTFHAHDESNEAHEGDLVRIVESRPLSATKRWRLVEVVERAK